MLIIDRIYEFLNTQDKELHNIAMELAAQYYPKWKLKVIYGSGFGYLHLEDESTLSYIGIDGMKYIFNSNIPRHIYKNHKGKYVTVYNKEERRSWTEHNY